MTTPTKKPISSKLAVAVPCAVGSCGNTTKHPSMMCHHHRGNTALSGVYELPDGMTTGVLLRTATLMNPHHPGNMQAAIVQPATVAGSRALAQRPEVFVVGPNKFVVTPATEQYYQMGEQTYEIPYISSDMSLTRYQGGGVLLELPEAADEEEALDKADALRDSAWRDVCEQAGVFDAPTESYDSYSQVLAQFELHRRYPGAGAVYSMDPSGSLFAIYKQDGEPIARATFDVEPHYGTNEDGTLSVYKVARLSSFGGQHNDWTSKLNQDILELYTAAVQAAVPEDDSLYFPVGWSQTA